MFCEIADGRSGFDFCLRFHDGLQLLLHTHETAKYIAHHLTGLSGDHARFRVRFRFHSAPPTGCLCRRHAMIPIT